MSQISKKNINEQKEKKQKSLAPGRNDMVKFRCYTRQIWSKLAGRLLTDEDIDEIINSFGGFVDVLSNMEVKHNEEK